MKESDLQPSKVFLEALNSLPLEYNYPLYSRIFDDFGTHYYSSGSLGGRYDLLYQYSAEELRNSGKWSLAKEDRDPLLGQYVTILEMEKLPYPFTVQHCNSSFSFHGSF